MKWWEKLKQNYRLLAVGVIALVVIVSLFIGVMGKSSTNSQPHNDFKDLNKPVPITKAPMSSSAITTQKEKIKVPAYVDVKGAVAHPGVYQLMADARIETVVALAGGTLPTADLNQLNLAQVVKDQQIVYVPKKGEKVPAQLQMNQDIATGNVSNMGPNNGAIDDSSNHKIVNLNTATKEDLQTLTGVGARKADAILQYRQEHGQFKTIDELKEVDGIGEKTFIKLKPYLSI